MAYKKVKALDGSAVILRLRIDPDVPRMNGIGSRKCRAERVFVLGVESGPAPAEFYVPWTFSHPDISCRYRVGEYTVAHEYNGDPRLECTGGIHFFMTKKEAEEW